MRTPSLALVLPLSLGLAAFAGAFFGVAGPSIARAQDVSDEVLPTAQERAILFVTNEVRNDPGPWPTPVEAGYDTWPCKRGEPENLPPLEWNPDLAAAARFHANDMHRNDHFDHASSDGTPFFRRVARFYDGGGMGENIAWGQSGPVDVLGAWMTSPGHRCNILGPEWTELGTGFAGNQAGGNPYYVQNFGARGGVERSRIPAGIAYSRSRVSSRYGVNWYDPEHQGDGAEPTIVVVRSSGCADLSLGAGLPHQGTYDWVGEPDDFPEEYWFIAIDPAGDLHTYPATGALTTPLPVHSDDRIDHRPMPECATLLLAGGDPGPADPAELNDPADPADTGAPVDPSGDATAGQQPAPNPTDPASPSTADPGASRFDGGGSRARGDQGCRTSAAPASAPALPPLSLKTLLRR